MYLLTEKKPENYQLIFYITEYTDTKVMSIGMFWKMDPSVHKCDRYLYMKGARYRLAGFDPRETEKSFWDRKINFKGSGTTFDDDSLVSKQIRYWAPCELGELPFENVVFKF